MPILTLTVSNNILYILRIKFDMYNCSDKSTNIGS